MNAALPFAMELSLLIALQIAIFSGTRSLVLYGRHAQKLVALLGCIGLCVLIGWTGYKSYQRLANASVGGAPAGFISQPDFSANLTPAMRENTGRNYAQQVFLDTGSMVEFTLASGEKVRFTPSEEQIDMRAERVSANNRKYTASPEKLGKAMVWGFVSLPVLLFAYLFARRERKHLLAHHGFHPAARIRIPPKTFAEVEGFISMLQGACEDAKLHTTLELILSQSDDGRKAMIHALLGELRANHAPQELIEAFVCLLDNDVAEKAYVVIHKCERPANMQPPPASVGAA